MPPIRVRSGILVKERNDSGPQPWNSCQTPDSSSAQVFEPLLDMNYFAQVHVDPELGTVAWPNGADLDPDVLYGEITGTPVLFEADFHLTR
jgi:hypothetical protein